jgi:hypothetical protein
MADGSKTMAQVVAGLLDQAHQQSLSFRAMRSAGIDVDPTNPVHVGHVFAYFEAMTDALESIVTQLGDAVTLLQESDTGKR